MDLIKTGKYIADKRKSLGLTQKQVAEKLGMSDKSVSKWERGICLPDVSVYITLCDMLDRKSTRLNSSHMSESRMPSSA